MVKFTVPLSDILGSAYYRYELSSSNYNPTIDSTITITCTCKNVLGNPIANKTLELMMNGVSQGTSTTNANGIATWSITFSDWGNKHFHIGNANLDLVVTGWKTVAQGTWYNLKTNGEFVELTMFGSHSVNISTNWTTALSIANDTYRPQQIVMGIGYNQTLYQIKTNGDIQIARFNGSATSTTATGTYYWKLK